MERRSVDDSSDLLNEEYFLCSNRVLVPERTMMTLNLRKTLEYGMVLVEDNKGAKNQLAQSMDLHRDKTEELRLLREDYDRLNVINDRLEDELREQKNISVLHSREIERQERVRKECDTLRGKNTKMLQDNVVLRKGISSTRSEERELKEETDRLKEEFSKLKHTLSRKERDLQRQLTDLAEGIDHVKKSNAHKEILARVLVQEGADLKQDVARKTSENDQAATELRNLKEECENTTNLNKRYKEELQDFHKQKPSTKDARKKLNDEVIVLRQGLSVLRSSVVNEMKNLASQISTFGNTIHTSDIQSLAFFTEGDKKLNENQKNMTTQKGSSYGTHLKRKKIMSEVEKHLNVLQQKRIHVMLQLKEELRSQYFDYGRELWNLTDECQQLKKTKRTRENYLTIWKWILVLLVFSVCIIL